MLAPVEFSRGEIFSQINEGDISLDDFVEQDSAAEDSEKSRIKSGY
jgi:hypothetical protein